MRKGRNERGAAAVEFAVVLPLLVLILLSMVDFGRYFYTRVSLSSASFEVADAISRGLFTATDDSAAKRNKMLAVIDEVSPGIATFAQLNPSATLTLDPIPSACPNASSSTVTKIGTTFNSISPFKSFFSEVSSSTSLRCLR